MMIRFIVDVKDEEYARTLTLMLNQAESQDKVRLLDRGDPLERLKVMVKQIREAIRVLEESGIDTEIMISYIHAKTRLPMTTIKKVLSSEIDFLRRMGQIHVEEGERIL